MLSAVRKRITYANVAMTLALVFAMTGGAYAAKHYLITSTKQISPKVLKQLKGAKGPAGAAGAQGPAGPQGPAGANGKDGTNGENGKEGVAGKSVVAAAEAKGANCKEGGSSFEVEGSKVKHYACNGEPGPLLTALPSGKMLTGVWSASGLKGTTDSATISYQFPLAEIPSWVYIWVTPHSGIYGYGQEYENNTLKANLQLKSAAEVAKYCPGSAAEPEAEPGFLCIYTTIETAGQVWLSALNDGLRTRFGFVLPEIEFTGAEEGRVQGTWAVKAK